MTCCPVNTTGCPETSSCNFAKATRLPLSVSAPTNSDSRITVVRKGLKAPIWRKYSENATRADAAPPSPLYRATIWGMAVILTSCEAKMPTVAPIATPRAIQRKSVMPPPSSVTPTASSMATAENRLPRGAVSGELSILMPMMNSTAESR